MQRNLCGERFRVWLCSKLQSVVEDFRGLPVRTWTKGSTTAIFGSSRGQRRTPLDVPRRRLSQFRAIYEVEGDWARSIRHVFVSPLLIHVSSDHRAMLHLPFPPLKLASSYPSCLRNSCGILPRNVGAEHGYWSIRPAWKRLNRFDGSKIDSTLDRDMAGHCVDLHGRTEHVVDLGCDILIENRQRGSTGLFLGSARISTCRRAWVPVSAVLPVRSVRPLVARYSRFSRATGSLTSR